MASVTLVHPEETFSIPALQAMTKCLLFQKNPALLASPYQVQSSISLSVFQEFSTALTGNAIEITDANFTGIKQLCEEFGFDEIAAKLSEFRPSVSFKEAEDMDAHGRIAALEEKANQHDDSIKVLQNKVKELSADFGRLVAEVSALRSAETGIQTGQKLGDSIVQQLSTEFSELQKEVLTLKAHIAAMSPTTNPSQILQPSPSSPALSTSPQQPSAPLLDSRIISDFPEIFAEFQEKRFWLLWRGSCDGFKGDEFTRRCGGHPNTLTVILDTKGNIFGGFTPVAWEGESLLFEAPVDDGPPPVGREDYSYTGYYLGDDSQKSFVFTLKNPHNIPARKFALKSEMSCHAINYSNGGHPFVRHVPISLFGDDILISEMCSQNNESWTCLGRSYGNDSGLDEDMVFTGSLHFQVKEIEVFEIRD